MSLQTVLFTYIVLQSQQIHHLEGAIAQKEQQIAADKQQLLHYREELNAREVILSRQAQNMADCQQQLADREAQLALQEQKMADYQQQLADKDAQLVRQEQAMQALQVRLGEVEAILRQNSTNSSKPPSTDQKPQSAKKPLKLGIPRENNRKRGGQPGHKGTTILPPTKVDHEHDCQPHVCSNPNCGTTCPKPPLHSKACVML